MTGHRDRMLHQKLWRQAIASGGTGRSKRQQAYSNLLLKRDRDLRETHAQGVIPDFYSEFLPAATIESDDPKNPGVIAFKPYDYQREMFDRLLNHENIVWLKERQIGASWALAAFAYWKAAYHPSSHVALISMGQRESDELLRKVRFIHNHLPPELYREFIGHRNMEFSLSGSTLAAFPSTESSGVSFRFSLIVQDEAARHPYGRQNYLEYLPTVAQGGQIVICSTSNPELGQSGFFYDIVQETIEGENDYHLVFNGRYSRPEHDEAFYDKMRRRYKMGKTEFDSHYPLSIGDAFVGKSGLVFHQFDRTRHVTQLDPMDWLEYDYRIAGIDPGGGDPTAIVVLGVWQNRNTGEFRFHQPEGGEFYVRGGASVEDMLQFLSRWPSLNRIYIDTAGGETTLKTISSYGLPIYPALKERPFGLGLIGDALDQDHLTIHQSNENSIMEFYGFRWLERTDPSDRQRYKTATPIDNHADAMDARRYAIASFMRVMNRAIAGGTPMPYDKGKPAPEKRRTQTAIAWR